ncbi:MAG: flagellar export chaperone FliS [Terriglobales bacterium]
MNIPQTYREAAIRGANPVALVVRLYEQMIEDMRQVNLAIENNDIQRRSDRIKHVLLVIAHLQSTLDFDRGGKVSQDLNHFYDALRQNVMWVQFHPSKGAATQVITDLFAVRQAWVEVERVEHPSVNHPARTEAAKANGSSDPKDALIAPHRLSRAASPYLSDSASLNASRNDWNG